jgi:outer membrane usher protein
LASWKQRCRRLRIYPDSQAVIKDNGYGIVGYLVPYKYNEVYADPKGTAYTVEVDDTRRTIVPTSGAAVLIKMDTRPIARALCALCSLPAK